MKKRVVALISLPVIVFLSINIASAVSPLVSDVINDLPLGEQVTFLANEIDDVKREQACQRAEIEKQKALEASGIDDADTTDNLDARRQRMLEVGLDWRLVDFDSFYNSYKEAISTCSQ